MQLARNPQRGGNPKGRGGKGKKHRKPPPRRLAAPPKPSAPPKPRPEPKPYNPDVAPHDYEPAEPQPINLDQHLRNGSTMARLLGASQDVEARANKQKYARHLAAADQVLRQPGRAGTKAYLEALSGQLNLNNVTLQDTTGQHGDGAYSEHGDSIELNFPSKKESKLREQMGYGSMGEQAVETATHEFTHAYDLGHVKGKHFRRQILAGLNNEVPAPQNVNEHSIQHLRDRYDIIDPHADHTIGQSLIAQNADSLLTETIANFAEIGTAEDPVSHIMRRSGVHPRENEDAQGWQQRVSGNWDHMMSNIITPYVQGLQNQPDTPQAVKDYYMHNLLRMPTGQGLTDEIQSRYAKTARMLNPAVEPDPRARLKLRLQQMRQARAKKR